MFTTLLPSTFMRQEYDIIILSGILQIVKKAQERVGILCAYMDILFRSTVSCVVHGDHHFVLQGKIVLL